MSRQFLKLISVAQRSPRLHFHHSGKYNCVDDILATDEPADRDRVLITPCRAYNGTPVMSGRTKPVSVQNWHKQTAEQVLHALDFFDDGSRAVLRRRHRFLHRLGLFAVSEIEKQLRLRMRRVSSRSGVPGWGRHLIRIGTLECHGVGAMAGDHDRFLSRSRFTALLASITGGGFRSGDSNVVAFRLEPSMNDVP